MIMMTMLMKSSLAHLLCQGEIHVHVCDIHAPGRAHDTWSYVFLWNKRTSKNK